MIRVAKLADYESCFAISSKFFSLYPHLIPNKESIRRLFNECVSGAQNCAFVAERNGCVVGCLLAVTHDHIWAQKKSNSVLIWACEHPGESIALLKTYRKWIDERPVIRRAGFQFDIDVNTRIYRALEACGFARKGGCFLREKGIN